MIIGSAGSTQRVDVQVADRRHYGQASRVLIMVAPVFEPSSPGLLAHEARALAKLLECAASEIERFEAAR